MTPDLHLHPVLAANFDAQRRAEDALALRLLGMGSWAACQAIEANYRGGILSADAAIMLLRAHTQRLALEITMIEARIRGMVSA